MAISYVGSASGTNTATPPAHQAGDCFVVFAFRDGSNSVPAIDPSFTTVQQNLVNSAGAIAGVKIAASSSETVGTWTNATGLILLVYRGTDRVTPVGGDNVASAASTSVTYPLVPMARTNSTSWIVGVAGHRSIDTGLEGPPTGMTNRINLLDATDELAGHDTNGVVNSWAAQTVAVAGTSSGWAAMTLELLVPTPHQFNNTGLRPHQFSPGLAR